ncbi:MAG: hypothetical protein LPK86_07980, partial [Alphaproteobacteria bacterium]|nr:hypothetical protein [Alphaproteobacteria bacterium]
SGPKCPSGCFWNFASCAHSFQIPVPLNFYSRAQSYNLLAVDYSKGATLTFWLKSEAPVKNKVVEKFTKARAGRMFLRHFDLSYFGLDSSQIINAALKVVR